jgi:hypothetical protein
MHVMTGLVLALGVSGSAILRLDGRRGGGDRAVAVRSSAA